MSLLIRGSNNGRCVRSLTLLTINRQRATIILSNLFDQRMRPKSLSDIPTPRAVSRREHLLSDPRVLGCKSHTADIAISPLSVFRLLTGLLPFPWA